MLPTLHPTAREAQRAIDAAFDVTADERRAIFTASRLPARVIAASVAAQRRTTWLGGGVLGLCCALIVGGVGWAWREGVASAAVAVLVAVGAGGGGGALVVFTVWYGSARVRRLRDGVVSLATGNAERAVWHGKPPRHVVRVDAAGWLTVPAGAYDAIPAGARLRVATVPGDHVAVAAELG